MTDTIDRIAALLEAGRCAVHPHAGSECEINLTYQDGKPGDIWVKRWKDWRGVTISHTGNRNLALSDEDAAKLNPIIDRLLYEERDKRHFFLRNELDRLERTA